VEVYLKALFSPQKFVSDLRMINSGAAAANLRLYQAEIIEIWEDWARKEVGAARERDPLVLRDKLTPFLDRLAYALTPTTVVFDATEGNDLAKQHGQHRASTDGYNINQVIKEYSLLRKTVLSFLQDKQTLAPGEEEIINDSIDKAMADAAQEFANFKETSLHSALQEAERSNRDLEHFAEIAAHDLKSPLASITGFTELINEEVRGQHGQSVDEAVDFVLSASERMRRLIDRILDYSHVTTRAAKFSQIDLNGAFNTAVANLSQTIESAAAIVTHKELPEIVGDFELIVQLFQNLIANGIKYNKQAQPEICASCVEEDNHWIIELRDNGIGFDPKEKEAVFAPYKRLHSASEYKGSGLGLATARRVVEIHRGRIWADSTPGLGSSFYIRLAKKFAAQ
jgi:signal transduction histidine kinase